MMKSIRIIAIVMSVYLLGTVLPDISSMPLLNLSLIDTTHAARPAAHRSAHRTARPTRGHTNVDVDVRGRGGYRRDVNVDVNRRGRQRSVDVDVRRRPTVGGVARAIAVGTRVATLPHGCTTVVTYGVTYHHCGAVYYRRYYQGTTLVYVVVDAP